MAKLSKALYKLHERACEIIERGAERFKFVDERGDPVSYKEYMEKEDERVSKQGGYTVEPLNEVEFVITNWSPNAQHVIGAVGAFFTPLELAYQLHPWIPETGRIVDICAGIGTLAYAALEGNNFKGIEVWCIENNHAFVEIGKKLLPQANWILADAYDIDTWKDLPRFDHAIMNPPYGLKKRTKWIEKEFGWCGGSEFEAFLVAYKFAGNGVAIVGQNAAPWWESGERYSGAAEENDREDYKTFRKSVPQIEFNPSSIDTTVSGGEFVEAKGTVVEIITFGPSFDFKVAD